MKTDFDGFAKKLDQTGKGLEGLTRKVKSAADSFADSAGAMAAASASFARGPSGGGSGGGGASGAQAMGADVAGAFLQGLAPLNTIGATISAQIDRIGGTIVTFARRIDEHIKFSATEAALLHLAENAKNDFVKIGAAGAAAALKVKNWWENLGDVARRSLSQVAKVNTSFRASVPIIGATTTAVRGLGVQVAVALGAFGLVYKAISGLGDFLKSSITGASDLNETLSKAGSIFGSASASMIAEADVMATKYGVVKKEFLEGSIGIANMGKAAGKTNEDAVALGNTFAKLGADLTSQDNLTFAEAMQKLQSGLAGEAEPLRRFGVLLSEDAVKTKALAMGATKVSGKLTEQAKVTARAALIQEGLVRVNGDLARTYGENAGQARGLSGTIKNLSASVGAILLPVTTKARSMLIGLASSAGAAFERNKPMFQGWVDSIVSGLTIAESLFRNWRVVLEIAQLKLGEWAENGGRIFNAALGYAAKFGEWLGNNWVKLIHDALAAVQTLWLDLATNIGRFASSVVDYFKDPTKGFHVDFKPLLDDFKATAGKLPEMLMPELISMDREIQDLWDRAAKVPPAIAAAEAMAKPKAAEAEAKEGIEKRHGAGAFELGSKEAYNSIVKGIQGRDEKSPIKEQQKGNAILERIARDVAKFNQSQAGDGPVLPFSFG